MKSVFRTQPQPQYQCQEEGLMDDNLYCRRYDIKLMNSIQKPKLTIKTQYASTFRPHKYRSQLQQNTSKMLKNTQYRQQGQVIGNINSLQSQYRANYQNRNNLNQLHVKSNHNNNNNISNKKQVTHKNAHICSNRDKTMDIDANFDNPQYSYNTNPFYGLTTYNSVFVDYKSPNKHVPIKRVYHKNQMKIRSSTTYNRTYKNLNIHNGNTATNDNNNSSNNRNKDRQKALTERMYKSSYSLNFSGDCCSQYTKNSNRHNYDTVLVYCSSPQKQHLKSLPIEKTSALTFDCAADNIDKKQKKWSSNIKQGSPNLAEKDVHKNNIMKTKKPRQTFAIQLQKYKNREAISLRNRLKTII